MPFADVFDLATNSNYHCMSFPYMFVFGFMILTCVLISIWVLIYMVWQVFNGSNFSSLDNEDNLIEFIWTGLPAYIVMSACLYNVTAMVYSAVPCPTESVVKVTGHQWYWSYETQDCSSGYDSLMLDFIDSVDKPLRLTARAYHQLLVTSADVIHSFAIPGLSLKMDAIPGRINQCRIRCDKLGIYVGYCSELCGAGHAYMPIVLESVLKPVILPPPVEVPPVSFFTKVKNYFWPISFRIPRVKIDKHTGYIYFQFPPKK